MKKALILQLLALLLCAALCAAGAEDALYSPGQREEPAVSDNPDGLLRCNLTLSDGESPTLEWSDEANVYRVTGDADALRQSYIDLLAIGGWDSCRLVIDEEALLSFGSASERQLDTLDDYLSAAQSLLEVRPAAWDIDSLFTNYVLNTHTHKFHEPDCPSVRQIKGKNRRDFTGPRFVAILMGYDPCGNCNP